jgi:hypothetical protein
MSAAYNDTLFRQQFPEFANITTYPATVLSGYWGMGLNFLKGAGQPWGMLDGNAYMNAMNAVTAHLLVLGMRAAASITPGAAQGGYQTGSNIDGISVQKLAPPVKSTFAWWLAQTSYGQMVLALISIAGVGGVSIGGLPEREAFRKAGGVFL